MTTTNNGYHPHGRAMFSDAALKAFKKFVDVDNATKHQRPAGAQDAMTNSLRRALSRAGIATDAMGEGQPDPEVINTILEALKGSIPDAGIVKIMKSLDQKWPGCCGELNDGEHVDNAFMNNNENNETAEDEDDADADNPYSPANPNPQTNIRGKGTEGFDKPAKDDGFQRVGEQNLHKSGPLPFRGMPKPGGRMEPIASDGVPEEYYNMFPNARRIREDLYVTDTARSNNVHPTTVRVSRRGLALDSIETASDDAADYAKMFGNSHVRVL